MLLFEQPERCRDELTEAGVAVEVSAPLESTSPEVLLGLLVIGLLLLPELTELEVGGVVTLRRAVAEARGEATQARAEAAEARLVSTQLAAQVSSQLTANPTAVAGAASNTTINNYLQARETAEAQQQLTSGTTPPAAVPVMPTLGESTLVAFTAGLTGLAAALPTPGEGVGVSVVGLTLTADRDTLEATHNPFEVADDLVEYAEQLLNDRELLPGYVVTALVPEGDAVVTATLALVGENQVVGGLAAVLQPTPPRTDSTKDDPLVALAAGVRVAAGAYAQLLVGLLGEQPVEGW